MLKKREYKDMDKLNQMTSERDALSKECSENRQVIEDLNAKLENLNLVIKFVTTLSLLEIVLCSNSVGSKSFKLV